MKPKIPIIFWYKILINFIYGLIKLNLSIKILNLFWLRKKLKILMFHWELLKILNQILLEFIMGSDGGLILKQKFLVKKKIYK